VRREFARWGYTAAVYRVWRESALYICAPQRPASSEHQTKSSAISLNQPGSRSPMGGVPSHLVKQGGKIAWDYVRAPTKPGISGATISTSHTQSRPARPRLDTPRLDELERQSLRAESATTMIGPYAMRLVHVRSTYPDGDAFELDVLLMGEQHTAAPKWDHPGSNEMTVAQFLQAATYRGIASNACVDIFIEDSIQRSAVVYSVEQLDLSQSKPTDITLKRVRDALADCVPGAKEIKDRDKRERHCTLGSTSFRVHTFDTRVNLAIDASDENGPSVGTFRSQLNKVSLTPKWMLRDKVPVMHFLMGLDPFGGFTDPPTGSRVDDRWRSAYPEMMDAFRSTFLQDDHKFFMGYMRKHKEFSDRARKRARKLGVAKAAALADLVVATSTQEEFASTLFANASDFYLLLRMMSPYPTRAGSPCAADSRGGVIPHLCIVYGGCHHCDHILRIFGEIMKASEWKMQDPDVLVPKECKAPDIQQDGVAGVFATLGQVLDAMGLAEPRARQRQQRQQPRRPPPLREPTIAPGHPAAKHQSSVTLADLDADTIRRLADFLADAARRRPAGRLSLTLDTEKL